MKITIRFYLADMAPQLPGHDYELERRLFLADKIRERADTNSLGKEFLGFQFNTPNLNAQGPQSVDFIFEGSDNRTQGDETERLRVVVKSFMGSLRQ